MENHADFTGVEIKPWEDLLSKNLSLSPLNSILWGFNQTPCAFFQCCVPTAAATCILLWMSSNLFSLCANIPLLRSLPSWNFFFSGTILPLLGLPYILKQTWLQSARWGGCNLKALVALAYWWVLQWKMGTMNLPLQAKQYRKCWFFLSAMNIVLSSIFTSAVGCSVLPGIDCNHCKVAEVPSCHAASYLGLVGVGKTYPVQCFSAASCASMEPWTFKDFGLGRLLCYF